MSEVCHFLIGPAGSGKSTLAQRLQAFDPSLVLLSTDTVRAQLYGDETVQGSWPAVEQAILHQAQHAFATGRGVIYDATNVARSWRLGMMEQFLKLAAKPWLAWQLAIPLETCLRQNETRSRQVPVHIIKRHFYLLNQVAQRPDPAEGFLAIHRLDKVSAEGFVVLPEPEAIPEVLAQAHTSYLRRINKWGAQHAHGYTRLVDFERLLYILALILEIPGLGQLQKHDPLRLQNILGQEVSFLTPEEEVAAVLSQRYGSVYGQPPQVARDLAWLTAQSLLNPQTLDLGRQYQPLALPPWQGERDARIYHTYGEAETFTRLLSFFRYVLYHPDVHKPEELTQARKNQVADQLRSEGIIATGDALRRDLERALRPYGLLPLPTYRRGYFAGTAIFNKAELHQIRDTLACQSRSLENPSDLATLELLNQRLKITNLGDEPYPIRRVANWLIVDKRSLTEDSLYHALEALEGQIRVGQPILLRHLADRGWPEDEGKKSSVWPLQLVYFNIAWYLAYERVDNGLFSVVRLDRLLKSIAERQAPRGEKAQRRSLANFNTLLEGSAFLYLGKKPEDQKKYLNKQTRAEVEQTVEVWFTEKLARFIREGTQRFKNQRAGDSPDPNFPYQLQLTFPVWSLDDIELQRWLLAYGDQAKVVEPVALVKKLRELSRGMSRIYSSED